VLPALRDFALPAGSSSNAPCLVLVSAGFDGARGDEGCCRDEVTGLDLTPDDFAWATAQIRAVMDAAAVTQRERAKGKPLRPTGCIVSVLEGGYGEWDDQTGDYNRSSLADCCAAHVRAL
jgi:acetoin utilization deacetylase AcuC-like enzyme